MIRLRPLPTLKLLDGWLDIYVCAKVADVSPPEQTETSWLRRRRDDKVCVCVRACASLCVILDCEPVQIQGNLTI